MQGKTNSFADSKSRHIHGNASPEMLAKKSVQWGASMQEMQLFVKAQAVVIAVA